MINTPYWDSVRDIVQSLEHEGDDWQESRYEISHTSGLSIWTANGVTFISIEEPHKQSFGLIGKLLIWKAIKRWRARQTIAKYRSVGMMLDKVTKPANERLNK